jgi:hypothetical protein
MKTNAQHVPRVMRTLHCLFVEANPVLKARAELVLASRGDERSKELEPKNVSMRISMDHLNEILSSANLEVYDKLLKTFLAPTKDFAECREGGPLPVFKSIKRTPKKRNPRSTLRAERPRDSRGRVIKKPFSDAESLLLRAKVQVFSAQHHAVLSSDNYLSRRDSLIPE